MTNNLVFGVDGTLTLDFSDHFSHPFGNPSELAKQPAGKEPLTPASNITDSFSAIDKQVKMEEDGERHVLSLKRKRPEPHNREDTNDKRKELLQKNRVAAQKCRLKKKKETEGMMQDFEQLEKENEKLKRETKQLTEETNNLKMMIMSHISSTPGCGYFNQWIDSQAQAVIKKKRSADRLERGPSGRKESVASSNFIPSAEMSPQQEPSYTFDDDLRAPPASWAMQPQSMIAMDTSFTNPMAPYSNVSFGSLHAYDPIDPSLTTPFRTAATKDESEYSYHSLPGGGTPDTFCASPAAVKSPTTEPALIEDSAMVSLPE